MRSGDYFFSRWKGRLIHSGIHILSHLRLLVRWVFYSVLMGILVGFIGIAFVYAIQWATGFRLGHWWVIGLLPLGGLLIVWLYRISHDQNDKGTNMVLASLRAETELPVQMAPLIFVSTVVTHFCGGSAGREGAALQLGGSVGSVIGRLFRLAERDKQVLMLCGMFCHFPHAHCCAGIRHGGGLRWRHALCGAGAVYHCLADGVLAGGPLRHSAGEICPG